MSRIHVDMSDPLGVLFSNGRCSGGDRLASEITVERMNKQIEIEIESQFYEVFRRGFIYLTEDECTALVGALQVKLAEVREYKASHPE